MKKLLINIIFYNIDKMNPEKIESTAISCL
jgi:hypothetical protein